MTLTELVALAPIAIVVVGAVLLLLILAFQRSHGFALAWSLAVLAFGSASLFLTGPAVEVTPLLRMDDYARFFIGLIYGATSVTLFLSHDYMRSRGNPAHEHYLLLILAAVGAAVLVASTHFASFFLGLEILSVSLYALLAFLRRTERGVEAGTKYLVLAGTSSSFLLFGMALIYAETGVMDFGRIASAFSTPASPGLTASIGLGLLFVGMGFKMALVPFHVWTPDVYEGAPAPVTAFVATVSKGAMLALVMRFFAFMDFHTFSSLFLALAAISIASMLAGNMLALFQTNIKRILAYSSIAQLGYMMVAFLASGLLGVTAVAFYQVCYFATMLGAFAVVSVLSGPDGEAERLDDYRGLYLRRPWLAMALTAMLLSLGGVPLTAGFMGKFYLVAAGVGSAMWLLVSVLVIMSAVSLFYYARIIVMLFTSSEGERTLAEGAALPVLSVSVLFALAAVLLWLGVYPAPLVQWIESMVKL